MARTEPTVTRVERAAPWVLVLVAATVVVTREPAYLIAPNFWAEEGTFFACAWSQGTLAGLVQRPAGYLPLYTSASTTLAATLTARGFIPLAGAPFVTAGAGLLAQLLPICLIAFSAFPSWGGPVRRSVGIAATLFGGLTGGMWLNSLTSLFFLALAAVLILMEPAVTGRTRAVAYACVIALTGLTGPMASLLAPLFVWKAWRTRSGPVAVQAAVLVACGLIHATWLAAGVWQNPALATRFHPVGLAAIVAIVGKRAAILPVLGVNAAEWFGRTLTPLLGQDLEGAAAGRVAAGLGALLAAFLVWLARGLPAGERLWLPGSFVIVSFLSVLGSVGDPRGLFAGVEGGQRYFYVPGVVLLWLLLHNVRPGQRLRAGACAALLGIALVTGMMRWRSSVWWRSSWPSWSSEVSAWNGDPHRPLLIWPPGWTIRLDPRG